VELTVRGLSKSYGSSPALQEVDLRLQGGVVALLGRNGSGKTTLLRCLATALKPDRGEMRFCGLRYPGDYSDLRLLRSGLGYLPQELDLPAHMTPIQLLNYLAQLKGIEDERQAHDLLAQVGLADRAGSRFDQLSGGQVRLVGAAQAFLGSPLLVILDELTRGLDLQERIAVFKLVRRMRGMVVVSTHVPQDVEQIADQVVVLHSGSVLFSGDISRLYDQTGVSSLESAYLHLLNAKPAH
jgi:ABC-2 type transport system ATP-binding protein